MAKGLVVVFGANGFLGRQVMRELVKDGWRIRAAVRRPHTAQGLMVNGSVGQIQLVQANLRFKKSVEQALVGADAVINLAGISYKSGRQTFTAVHTLGAKTLAEAASAAGITNFVQISSLGAAKEALSDFSRSKFEGEEAVKAAVPTADIVRVSNLFGKGQGIFIDIARLAQLCPVLPIFGGGSSHFQPLYVGDAAEAVATLISQGSTGKVYELAGPNIYSAKEIIAFTLSAVDKKRLLLPMPWFFGTSVGFVFEFLGAIPIVNLLIKPFITRDMIKGMKTDKLVSGNYPGLAELGIQPQTVEAIVPPTLEHLKTHGQFHIEAAN